MIDPTEGLKAFLDGELDQADADQVRRALAADPELACEAARYLAISAALAQERPIQPVGLEQTLEALRRNNQDSRPWWSWPNLIAPAGLAAAAAFLMIYLLSAQAGSSSTRLASMAKRASTQSTSFITDEQRKIGSSAMAPSLPMSSSATASEKAKAAARAKPAPSSDQAGFSGLSYQEGVLPLNAEVITESRAAAYRLSEEWAHWGGVRKVTITIDPRTNAVVANLRVDPRRASSLYARLRKIPSEGRSGKAEAPRFSAHPTTIKVTFLIRSK